MQNYIICVSFVFYDRQYLFKNHKSYIILNITYLSDITKIFLYDSLNTLIVLIIFQILSIVNTDKY